MKFPYLKVYLGGHDSYGEDGIEVVAERAIGRDDYGQPQFRKRSNMRQPRAQPLGGGGQGILEMILVPALESSVIHPSLLRL